MGKSQRKKINKGERKKKEGKKGKGRKEIKKK